MGCAAVTPVARIWEMPGSNLDRVPTIVTAVFRGIPQSFKANGGIHVVHRLGHDRFLPNTSQFVKNFSLRNIYVSSKTETAYSTTFRDQLVLELQYRHPKEKFSKQNAGQNNVVYSGL
jgi:hypothetical protein